MGVLLRLLTGNVTAELFDPGTGTPLIDNATGGIAGATLEPLVSVSCYPPGSPQCMPFTPTVTETWGGFGPPESGSSTAAPWWLVLLAVLALLLLCAFVAFAVMRQQKSDRKKKQTQFASDLGSPQSAAQGSNPEQLELPLLQGPEPNPPPPPTGPPPPPPAAVATPGPDPKPELAAAPTVGSLVLGMGVAPPRRQLSHLGPAQRTASPLLGPGSGSRGGLLQPSASRLGTGSPLQQSPTTLPLGSPTSAAYSDSDAAEVARMRDDLRAREQRLLRTQDENAALESELSSLADDLHSRRERLRLRQAENAALESELASAMQSRSHSPPFL
eukprot:TRINITY_DN15471_c0_g1_i3.p2 TRINITY_DN15471_c0_g1~~TRINITY_DN15471_c0_g1_i3.p2  ORF type:complete len:330 (+),score=133.83 TRINITY_DN15471_c0_g1_i3:659-1648(+)